MKKICTLALLCLATASFLTAQIPAIELKLQLLPDGESWGVFAKPKEGVSPSAMTITGSAQATVVMPLGFQWSNLQSHAGTWINDVTYPGPIENPGRTYTSFGLVTDSPQIQYAGGQETLLFSFKKEGDCPDSLYLIANGSDWFCQTMGNSVDSNPMNIFEVIDFGSPGVPIYMFSNYYAPSAWNCHDCDSDGIPNALDDSACLTDKCVELKLQYLPAKAAWAVKLRAKPGTPATTNNIVTAAGITLVAPQSFEYQNFTSKKGVWELSGTLENPAENPGMKYLTFELQPGVVSLNLLPWTETTLFTFKKAGDCPDSLYLMNGMTPQGLQPNEIKGQGQAFGQTHSIQLCGVYGLEAWSCLSPAPPDQLPVETDIQLQVADEIKTAKGLALDDRKNALPGNPAWFQISPNPATDWLDVSLKNDWPQSNATLRLLNLQGQLLHRENLPGSSQIRLDLTALQPGIYFLTLEADGKVVQRERVVKF